VNWIFEALVNNPEIALFLTLGLGFWIGKFSYRGISLGAVTGTLLVGVVIGAVVSITVNGTETNIEIANVTKQVFFLLFLFALGYRVGPQFFKGLKGNGRPQALFTVVLIAVGITSAIILSKVLGYNPGLAAGLTAGALTQSSIIGVAQDAISGLNEESSTLKEWESLVSVGYAVTYIFGTIGAAIYCSSIAPRMLGIKNLPEAAKIEEKRLHFEEPLTDTTSAYSLVKRRAFVLPDDQADIRVSVLGASFAEHSDKRVSIDRLRVSGIVQDPDSDVELSGGDCVAIATPDVDVFERLAARGFIEHEDPELLDFPIEEVDIVITSDEVVGKTLGDLATFAQTDALFIKSLKRAGIDMPIARTTEIHEGDQITIQGPRPTVEWAIPHAGYPERSTPQTDMVTVGLAIALGALIGLPSLDIGGVPMSLTSSVGAMVIGLIIGQRRAKSPTFGRIPPGAQWFFESVGLAAFVGIVGINAGPGFINGLSTYGAGLFFAGVFVTMAPLIISTYLARYVFKFDPVQTLGMLTGAQTTTAAIGAVRESARSSVPLLGFTIPYAIGNIILSIGGAIVVLFMA